MQAFRYALNIAVGNKESELIIFHAIPEPDAQFWKSYIYEIENIDSKAMQDIDRKINEIYKPALPQDLTWSADFYVGNVGEEILRKSREDSVDLIVMGRGSGKNVINRILGNYTEKIIRKALCPVLVVPDEEE